MTEINAQKQIKLVRGMDGTYRSKRKSGNQNVQDKPTPPNSDVVAPPDPIVEKHDLPKGFDAAAKPPRRPIDAKRYADNRTLLQTIHAADKQCVNIPRLVARLANGDMTDAAILAQLLWAFDSAKSDRKPRARVFKSSGRWWAKGHQELADEIGISARRVRTGLEKLRKAGLIEVEYHLFSNRRISHLRPVDYVIVTKLREVLSAGSER